MSPKNPAAVALGRKGGQATAANRTAAERSQAARKAVEARWARIDKSLRRTEKTLTELETKQARAARRREKRKASK